VKRVYTYAAGREETANEKKWVKDRLLADWAAQGYTMPALLRRITLDPGFYRVSFSQKHSAQASNTHVE
jgi:hypothetical protein